MLPWKAALGQGNFRGVVSAHDRLAGSSRATLLPPGLRVCFRSASLYTLSNLPNPGERLMASLPSYLDAAKPVPLSNRCPWYKTIAPTYLRGHALVRVLAEYQSAAQEHPARAVCCRTAFGIPSSVWSSPP